MEYEAVVETFCFTVKIFCISINNLNLIFEGGLLCVEN
jgi:hypothetical protein